MDNKAQELIDETKDLLEQGKELLQRDPRTPFERELDEWQADWAQTIKSVRPGL